MSETKTTRKQLPAYLILALIALAAAVLLWYLLAKPLSGGARNGGAGRPGSL